ncbi:MAG: electron transfer flavoprotein subunit alpha/FixB family protein [Chloroflexi bacterium]|nr:electron transfer flavoprotein subunit alpha/FixB family protein [Chloroflexota bacterium]
MTSPRGVLIVGEHTNGQLGAPTLELLAHGRALATALGEELAIALLGESLGGLPQEAIAYGADKVYAVTDPLLKEAHLDAYLGTLVKACEAHAPRIVLLARTELGRDLGPRLALRLNTALAQDCLEVRLDSDKRLVAVRPVYGGNCTAVVTVASLPMMAAIRPKTAEPLPRNPSRRGQVIQEAAGLAPSVIRTRVLQRVQEAQEGLRLETARVVVAGGRGLGGAEPFHKELQELASVLGAAVGATRAVVDIGWVPYSYQIGLTGKSISPDLYVTVGISGASQHMAGCSGAKVIVAINKDSEAAIFKAARYGVAGDWKKVLPAFTKQLRELL